MHTHCLCGGKNSLKKKEMCSCYDQSSEISWEYCPCSLMGVTSLTEVNLFIKEM